MEPPRGISSKIFEPLKIGNGKIELKHRVVLAPLTRNRCVSLSEDTPSSINRIWYPDELVSLYYAQRATKGGLLISEGIAPNLEGNGMPGVPGLFHSSHISGWRKVTEAVHAKGGCIYAQLWHAGRVTIEPFSGMPSVAPSAIPLDAATRRTPPGYSGPVQYRDYPPVELSKDHIKRTISDYCKAAQMAMEAGFDGVEIHGGNGYLPEQFLSSNINQRTDEYGGSPQKRCQFVIELMQGLAQTIGGENCAIRLSPFGLFNQTFGEQRIETWSFLCEKLKKTIPNLSYISLIEPRYEQIHSYNEKDTVIRAWGLNPSTINLKFLREIMGDTPFFSAGGWDDTNCWGVLETGECDALVMGRYFLSNPDLVERLRLGKSLMKYDRATFYGPMKDRHIGYTDYPIWEEQELTEGKLEVLEGVEVSAEP
ncbi:putative 12-oxophytodienoate reductase [Melanomma pulvis-pyrius CBS 109.77]|uniref:Putative 12-oxophytodienoate reductase n=1 Tax=Melanomma pulvis-pyrius CBS 109.77 TaxID=1314802 RepID=A0A6A6X961_9PLEO|nr:putative 12-oxophytodienoate reductase [Melanomma pulvis-pyrius CBS 109.77]